MTETAPLASYVPPTWQDQQFELYISDLQQALHKLETTPKDPYRVSEHLCEWTRELLSRAFGRVTLDQARQLSETFQQTADVIGKFDLSNAKLTPQQAETIGEFAKHIRNRCSLLPK